jgi:hypothetical protein
MFIMDVPVIGRRGATAMGFLFTWVGASLVPWTETRAQFIGLSPSANKNLTLASER